MSRTIDPFDEIAAMFLSRESTPESPPQPGQARSLTEPIQELLIVGHLPVRAGLWLVPYAEAISSRVGATALIRLDGDEPSLQLIRPAYDAPLQTDRVALSEVLTQLGPSTAAWLIRASSDASPDDLLACGAKRITILTSGDQAATVGAYQAIKSLAEAAQRSNRLVPPLGLAVLGVEDARAREVHERVNHTASECLNLQVELSMWLPKIGAGASAVRYLNFPGKGVPTLLELFSQIQSAAARFHVSPATRDTPVASPQPGEAPLPVPEAVEPQRRRPTLVIEEPIVEIETGEMLQPREPALRFEHEPLRIAPSRSGQRPPKSHAPPPTAPRARRPTLAEPKAPVGSPPITSMHEPAAADGRPQSLASFVKGLVGLPVRPPGHERVELAVDDRGVLHLLSRVADLRLLPVVAHWAKAHAEILSMACREHAIDSGRDAVCHVFTDEPAAVADLRDSGMHLHVLAPVMVDSKVGWYCAPLNKP